MQDKTGRKLKNIQLSAYEFEEFGKMVGDERLELPTSSV
jgi:hypothetical protein